MYVCFIVLLLFVCLMFCCNSVSVDVVRGFIFVFAFVGVVVVNFKFFLFCVCL